MHCKRERRRIVYIYNVYIIYVNNTLPLALAVHEIFRHFWAAYACGIDEDLGNKICNLASSAVEMSVIKSL